MPIGFPRGVATLAPRAYLMNQTAPHGLILMTGGLTIMCWMFLDGNETNSDTKACVIAYPLGSLMLGSSFVGTFFTSLEFKWDFGQGTAYPIFSRDFTTTRGVWQSATVAPIPFNTWICFFVTHDGTTGKPNFYWLDPRTANGFRTLNSQTGAAVAVSGTPAAGSPVAQSNGYVVGRSEFGQMIGALGPVRVWTSVLTNAEMLQAARGVAVKFSTTQTWLPMDGRGRDIVGRNKGHLGLIGALQRYPHHIPRLPVFGTRPRTPAFRSAISDGVSSSRLVLAVAALLASASTASLAVVRRTVASFIASTGGVQGAVVRRMPVVAALTSLSTLAGQMVVARSARALIVGNGSLSSVARTLRQWGASFSTGGTLHVTPLRVLRAESSTHADTVLSVMGRTRFSVATNTTTTSMLVGSVVRVADGGGVNLVSLSSVGARARALLTGAAVIDGDGIVRVRGALFRRLAVAHHAVADGSPAQRINLPARVLRALADSRRASPRRLPSQ